ncbi:MAG TPA: 2-oxoglutarate dehydrogenase, E2 component, dihydrolipoamide succinyltransferase, partial [Blastocatellia bacterium]|nr:2-oxoglutarate dehydrogenase, E2 component, dihydrolipoamide succinyltransferase [Blastocatellia bacterium]
DVLMPQMGESIAEGTVVKWLKKVGDKVERDEPLLEISTDKVDAEVPSPAAGVLLEILAKEGETVTVNAVIGRLGESGEAGASAPAPEPVSAPAPQAAEPGPAKEDPALAAIQTTVTPSAPALPAPPPAPVESDADGKKVRSSPLVRNIAREHGINLEQVPGTGLGGRVTKEDIMGFIERKAAPAPAPAPAAPAPAPTPFAPPVAQPVAPPAPAQVQAPAPLPAVPTHAAGDRITIEQMSNMRRRIAENMLNSRRTSAHVTTFFEVDFTNIARLRERAKKQFEAQNGTKLTFLPFVIKAAVDALKALPVVNASVEGDNIVYKHDYNVGIAVALDWGLIVPVIKQADALSITGLARSSQDLANRARGKQLKPDEISGGTFSITNFGLYGGYTATPIINQPQVAILGMGGIHKKPWVVETPDGDAIAIRHIGVLSLSFDHRIIDGAVGDQFLAHIKKTIETTDFSALL